MRRKVGNPAGLFNSVQYGFSQAALGSGSSIITLSGQVAWDANGTLIGERNIHQQAVAALRNIETALASLNSSVDDVISLRIYIVDFASQPSSEVTAALKQTFPGTEPPAATWVGVTSLARPELLIEIEATAVTDNVGAV